MAGERVAGKYELRRLLGAGSMGAVYEGIHVDLGKRLAIKLIHPEFCESVEVVARFRREARAASAVESDYIVQIYDFGRDDALGLYMVIEYLEGEDLETRLQRERWLAEGQAALVGLQVARGLARAHAAGIIHRDLKPANVFLTERDEDGSVVAKILDFGISKFDAPATSVAEPTLTAYGTTLGTPQYMSPEQCEGKVELDARTDVWSLCAVLYETLAGEPAFSDAGGHIAIMQRIVRGELTPLRERASWVSEKLARVVDAGLVRDRDRRIHNANTLAAMLLDACPEAGSRPSLAMIAHPTDASELSPYFLDEDAPPVTLADPLAAMEALAAAPVPRPIEAAKALDAPKLADTGNPASAEPPSSSNEGDSVAIFKRGEELPSELIALRKRKSP